MDLLGVILTFTLLGSVVSLVGGGILALRPKPFTPRQTLLLISFAAGVLLATAFFDLLPEAGEMAGEMAAELSWGWVLAGIVTLFLMEKLLAWFSHHGTEYGHRTPGAHTPEMITFGDTVHNFIDGVVIAGAFMASVPVGIVTSLAVAAHEVPHEMADFGVLLSKGWSKAKTLWVNLGSALAAVIGAVITYFMGDVVAEKLPYLLAFAAGLFVYLACSDLIPELYHEHGSEKSRQNLGQILAFGLGIGVVWLLVKVLEG